MMDSVQRVLTGVPDGVIAVVRAECPTCELVGPALTSLVSTGAVQRVFVQDDMDFPAGLVGSPALVDDRELDVSFHLDIETVPTLLRVVAGAITDTTVGWTHESWTTQSAVGTPDGASRKYHA